MEPTKEQKVAWEEWLADRPPAIRAVAERINPWTLYRLKETGQRCTLYSFSEGENGEVTVTVNITGQHNLIMFDRQVFGIAPDHLEPCESPSADEPVGSLLTDRDEIEAFVDAVRPHVLKNRRSS